MTPELRIVIEDLQKRLTALERVENVAFIENINRRAGSGIKAGSETVSTTILKSVSEGGLASYNVAKAPDNKRQIILQNGEVEYIGTYNS